MKKFIFSIFTLVLLCLTSCSKDPEPVNEEELITTLVYTLDAAGTNQDVVMTFRDLDGDGGQAPVITTVGTLKVGESYTGSLSLLNESAKPVESITEEIITEALEHQFFFEVSGALAGKLNITYNDKDSENNPIGLVTKITASSVGTGKVKVVLKHEPNKKGSGVKDGNIANAGGETDIEVTFDIEAK